jgi:transcriptional antiterminator RfaH
MIWYLVKSQPQRESVAVVRLNQLGIETFCPYRKKVKRVRGNHKTERTPLFPGYLFSKFNRDTQYRLVTYAQGVSKVVTFGEIPAVVDEEVIDSIKDRMQNGFVVIQPQSFRSGDAVRIQDGPLAGIQAVFEKELTGTERVVLLLKTVSYQARVLIDRNDVANIEADQPLGEETPA